MNIHFNQTCRDINHTTGLTDDDMCNDNQHNFRLRNLSRDTFILNVLYVEKRLPQRRIERPRYSFLLRVRQRLFAAHLTNLV
jgi:hypothetical protein